MSATLTDRTGSMGSLPPDAPPPISLPAQQGHLLRRYPNSRVVRRRERLLWSGTLTPAEYTATYELLIDHQIGKPPLVYVVRPRLRLVDGQGLPHVYLLNTLCLFLGNREWHQSIPIADTLVPWASEWLLFYELWLATGGKWLGEGEHSPPGPVNRHARRRHSREDTTKLTRLTTALRLVYGLPADLEELLFNARLTPTRPTMSPTSAPSHSTTDQADFGRRLEGHPDLLRLE